MKTDFTRKGLKSVYKKFARHFLCINKLLHSEFKDKPLNMSLITCAATGEGPRFWMVPIMGLVENCLVRSMRIREYAKNSLTTLFCSSETFYQKM